MKILLSPAKSIHFQEVEYNFDVSVPEFERELTFLVTKLKKMSGSKLEKMMHISKELGTLNAQRYANFVFPAESSDLNHPAVLSFSGEVYKGFDAQSLKEKSAIKAQDQLLILSGLYGFLKPFDLFCPYRLEMGTKWDISAKYKNLYSYWQNTLTKYLKSELHPNELLVNLASVEYSKAINFKAIENPTVIPQFKEFKNGKFSIVMMYAKHARGKMARHLIEHPIISKEELKSYNLDKYEFNDALSSEHEYVFVR
jgi:cytoplasmic iron level regulating protein YaaA (DUF328/UPF0246 family)